VRGSVELPSGELVAVAADVRVTVGGDPVARILPLPEGELRSVSVAPVATVARLGDATACLRLWAGDAASGREVAFLTLGFPGLHGECWWNDGGHNEWRPDLVEPYSMSVSTPAAGAEWDVGLVYMRCSELLGYSATLATDATAGNRYCGLEFRDLYGYAYQWAHGTAIPASSTRYIRGSASGRPDWVVGQVLGFGFGPWAVPSGWSVRSWTAGMQAGDQYTAVRLHGRWYRRLSLDY
jgi:antitoxin (DNA-binding transcriptional repressor) of toxin-antitoxin stability system